MKIGRIPNVTRVFAAEQAEYQNLPVRDNIYSEGERSMTSAWVPSQEEIIAIAAGAPVLLEVFGVSHPPVRLMVGDADPLKSTGSC